MRRKKKSTGSFGFAVILILSVMIILMAILIAAVSARNAKTPSAGEQTAPSVTSAPVATDGVTLPGETHSSATLPESPVTEPETVPETEPETDPVTEPPVTEPVTEKVPSVNLSYTVYNWNEAFNGTILPEKEAASQEYLDSIVFLGDSLTYGLKTYGMLTGGTKTTQVWFPSSGTICLNDVPDYKIYYPDTGEDITVREAIERKKPKYLCINLGVNGIMWLTETTFKQEYRKVIDTVRELSPDTVIIFQSIYPVGVKYEHTRDINNKKISQANVWVAQLAQEYGMYYLNTAEALLDDSGFMREDIVGGDFLHIGTAGYKIIIQYILTHPVSEG